MLLAKISKKSHSRPDTRVFSPSMEPRVTPIVKVGADGYELPIHFAPDRTRTDQARRVGRDMRWSSVQSGLGIE